MSINYVIGDATQPQSDGPKVIAHCVNDIGVFGSGFAGALNKTYPKVRQEYIRWSKDITSFVLGNVQFVQVESGERLLSMKEDIWVANIIGQHQTIRENPKPIRYEALRIGLRTTAEFCLEKGASMHAPRLGSKLARGDWSVIAKIIEEEVVGRGVSVTIYDLP